MRLRRWRKQQERSREAVCNAERLRDQAQEQQERVERVATRVDEVSSSLERLRTANHFGPMIDAILRGSE